MATESPQEPVVGDVHSRLVSRRVALAAGAVGVGTVALAGCGAGGGTGSPGRTPTVPANTALAQLDSIAVGECVSAALPGGDPVIVSRPTPSTAACFSAICTHQGCTVSPAGKQLVCPCHGSVYDALTGAVISGPAPSPLPAVPVHVADGEVVSDA